jgi:hypothetical protein
LTPDRLIYGWRQLIDVAQHDIVSLHGNRVVWREIVNMLEHNEAVPHRYFVDATFERRGVGVLLG